MNRRLITSTGDLRKIIAHITTAAAGRRVVVSAFVGSDALEFVPNPDGIEIYCWDQPSATDPEGVADLMQTATVWFVTGLHMKIYWSEHHGVLIGSPNLTRNALGEAAALLESAIYYDDSSAVNISKVESLLRNRRRRAEDHLDELRRRANRDPIARRGSRRRARSLSEYFLLKNPAPWRVSFWTGIPDDHVKADYEAVIGTQGIEDVAQARERLNRSMPAPRGTAVGDWLLSVIWTDGGPPRGPLSWLNVARVATVKGERRAYELTGPKGPAPFDCKERGFGWGFRRFLLKHVNSDEEYGITMTPKRIALLAEELGVT
jgi:hypothetical protein